MTTILEPVAWAVAITVVVTMALVGRGFLPVALRADGSTVYHLSAGVVLVFCASALRAIYWDVMPLIAGLYYEGAWQDWHAMVGRPLPNIIFGLLFILGGRHLLILFFLLIPEPDRVRYTILTAPFYPRSASLRAVVAMLTWWRR